MSLKVLYEDNHLIAVYKPAGLLVQGDIGNERCLMDEVKEYLKETHHKTGNVFLGLLHRLDRPVAGIVLFAKTSKGASRLSEQFRNHSIKKIYHALVKNTPTEQEATLVHFLKKNESLNKTTVFEKEVPGSQRAELRYKVLEGKKDTVELEVKSHSYGEKEKNNDHSLLEIELKTGRPHQIRSQLAFIGCPIVGDIKYGALTPMPDRSIALVAVRLTFKLATKDEEKTIEIKPDFSNFMCV